MGLTRVMCRYIQGSNSCLKAAYVAAVPLYKGTVTSANNAVHCTRDCLSGCICSEWCSFRNRLGAARSKGVPIILRLFWFEEFHLRLVIGSLIMTYFIGPHEDITGFQRLVQGQWNIWAGGTGSKITCGSWATAPLPVHSPLQAMVALQPMMLSSTVHSASGRYCESVSQSVSQKFTLSPTWFNFP